MKNRDASVLMISLWVLVILTVLAVSVGHRVSMVLRLAQYQRDSVNAAFLAKAGISRASGIIDRDNNTYDALNELWADNEAAFKKIVFGTNADEFASVSYEVSDGGITKTIFGARDEESKINIQTASKKLIMELGRDCFSDTVQLDKLAGYIQLWRGSGDDGGAVPTLGEKDKDFKKGAFANPQELLVVLEYFFRDNGYQDYRKKARDFFACVEDKITVWGEGKVNINTAPEDVLSKLFASLTDQDKAAALAADIAAQREANLRDNPSQAPFSGVDDLNIKPENKALFLSLNPAPPVTFAKSKYFRIQAYGSCAQVRKDIVAVYNREEKKIVYWHEN
ncbi:MAG: type II secretion system protein GspK [Candidatus Omnitrophica bacterium]|nr:type II secretion system protein GspK [Candidatus Omnitrophota bacterium]